jgi:hypothetical protein
VFVKGTRLQVAPVRTHPVFTFSRTFHIRMTHGGAVSGGGFCGVGSYPPAHRVYAFTVVVTSSLMAAHLLRKVRRTSSLFSIVGLPMSMFLVVLSTSHRVATPFERAVSSSPQALSDTKIESRALGSRQSHLSTSFSNHSQRPLAELLKLSTN